MPLPRALTLPFRWLRRPRVWIGLITCAGLSYTLTGFFVLPAVAKRQIPRRLETLLGRRVLLDSVSYNPFTHRIRLSGFAILEADGQTLAGFEGLDANLEALPFFRHEIRLEEVVLTGFQARHVIDHGGKTNFSDILERLHQTPAPKGGAPDASRPQESEAKPSRSWILHLATFTLSGARASFHDFSGPAPFHTELGPYSLTLRDFRTESGSLSTHHFQLRSARGESLRWEGSFGLDPLVSKGMVRLENIPLASYAPYYRPLVGFQIRGGTASLETAYSLAWQPTRKEFKTERGSLEIQELELAPQIGGPSEIRQQKVEFSGMSWDILGGELQVSSLHLTDGMWQVRLEADGSLSPLRLLDSSPQTAPPKTVAKVAVRPQERRQTSAPASPQRKTTHPGVSQPRPSQSGFRFGVDRILALGQRVSFQDLTLSRPVRADLAIQRLEAGPFNLAPDHATPLRLEAVLDQGGQLELTGRVMALRPAFTLQVKTRALDLPTFQGYADAFLKAPVAAGRLTANLKMEGHFENTTEVTLKGDAQVRGLDLRDPDQSAPLALIPDLHLKGLEVHSKGTSLQALELMNPVFHVNLDPQGSNLSRALGLAPVAPLPQDREEDPTALQPSPVTVPPAHTPEPARPSKEPGPPEGPTELKRLLLSGGTLHFRDANTRPIAALNLTQLHVHGEAFSTSPTAPSPLRLEALIDGVAPLRIDGRFNLLDPFSDSTLKLVTRGVDLGGSAPYLTKYLGYAYKKGKLDLDVDWQVRARALQAENRAVLDQFYLGEKVPGPDAVKAPIKLGLALLRDRRGVIRADLPVRGNLDAPDFRIRKLVWQAIGNLFTKLATSPFDALARLVGAKADLSQAVCVAGQADLEPGGEESLQALARALQERPELNVEILGHIDRNLDGLALRRQALDRKLAQVAGRTPLTESTRPTLLATLWRQAHPVAKGVKPLPLPEPEAMEAELLAGLPPIEAELALLGDRRAARIQEGLVTAGIELSRLFRLPADPSVSLAGVKFRVK